MKGAAGNALFLILIAVALFAALSYAVTNSSRGGVSTDREEAIIALNELRQNAAQISYAIQKMTVVFGVPLENLSFTSPHRMNLNSTGAAAWHNDGCTEPLCRVFSPDGGGAVYRNFKHLSVFPDPSWNAGMPGDGEHVPGLYGVEGLGTSLGELMLKTRAIPKDLCFELNRVLGLPDSPQYSFSGEDATGLMYRSQSAAHWASILALTNPHTFGNDFPDLAGAHEFCLPTGGSHNYGTFYQVLMER